MERLYEGEIENRAWAEATGSAGQRRGDNKTLQIDVSEMEFGSVSVMEADGGQWRFPKEGQQCEMV